MQVIDLNYLISIGATHVPGDRRLPLAKEALEERIAQLCGTPLLYAFDAISLEDTQRVAYNSLASGGKFIEVFLRSCLPKQDAASGKRVLHAWGSFEVTTPGVREFGQRFMRGLSEWLAEGKIKPNVVEVLPGGLSGMKAGLERLERGEVGARKFIIRPQETEF